MLEIQEVEYDHALQCSVMHSAVERMNAEEQFLIENDASERNICARLGYHLESVLREKGIKRYYADVEYNRGMNGHNGNSKRMDGALITLDLVVHQREYDEILGYRNLLCAEMKKSSNPEGCDDDVERLKKLTDDAHGFGYKMGFMLWVNQEKNRIEIRNVFVNGREWMPLNEI